MGNVKINHWILAPNVHHGTVVLHVVQLLHRRLHGGGVREVREGVAFGRLGVLRNQRNARTDSVSGQNVREIKGCENQNLKKP